MLRSVVVQDEPLASPVSPGEIVAGKYCVERVLGVGGMGVVVAARHLTLEQAVAIKFLVRSRFDSPEESIARFLAEARASARIESDFVCRVFDVGTLPNGVPFMVMEHLDGRDLDDELQLRGQLSLVESVDYVLQAADALSAAHALGIVHRDIKPANLFLATRPDGSRRVKVLDFGISKIATERVPLKRRAREATSLGSPAYMSPEQVRGAADVDARADIWGLGAILYELVTGQMAFVGDDVRAVLDMVLRDDPCPMNALRRDVPSELESIVMRCLDREREHRWPTAARFAQALAPYGSVGMFGQLASVQRELGSLSSIPGVRVSAAPSVEPMVASIGYTTQPDPEEVRAREEIARDWTKTRARQRTARGALVALSAAAFFAATVAVLLHFASTSSHRASSAATAAPPPVSEPAPPLALPSGASPATPSAAASAAAPAAEEGTVAAAPSAPASPAMPQSVHPARSATPRASASTRSPSRAAPRGSVNHLLDTRD